MQRILRKDGKGCITGSGDGRLITGRGQVSQAVQESQTRQGRGGLRGGKCAASKRNMEAAAVFDNESNCLTQPGESRDFTEYRG